MTPTTFVIFFTFFVSVKLKNLIDFEPPSIYSWIEENAHICTSVPSGGGDSLINFLSENEGVKCSLCPKIKKHEVPTSACAVETTFDNVEIGCYPIPELCLLELKTRYIEFFSPETLIMPTNESAFLATIDSDTLEHKRNSPETIVMLDKNVTDVTKEARIEPSQASTTVTSLDISADKVDQISQPEVVIELPDLLTKSEIKIQKRKEEVAPKERKCFDKHKLCCFWGMAGECNANPFWMRINCQKTCGTCNCSISVREADKCDSTGVKCHITTTTTTTTTMTTPTTTTTTTTKPSTTTVRTTTVTSRKRPFGKGVPTLKPPSFESAMEPVLWPVPARQLRRRTTTTPVPTTITTTSTTTTPMPTTTTTQLPTTTTENKCVNYHDLCNFWAGVGECTKNPFWMRPHCQEACNFCEEQFKNIGKPTETSNCKNAHKLCFFWTFVGECHKNPRWMGKFCKASCKLC